MRVGTQPFLFEEGETIHTESSRKFEIEELANIVRGCGWRAAEVWTDPDRLFAVFGLRYNRTVISIGKLSIWRAAAMQS